VIDVEMFVIYIKIFATLVDTEESQWSVVSGQWSVVSGQWLLTTDQVVTTGKTDRQERLPWHQVQQSKVQSPKFKVQSPKLKTQNFSFRNPIQLDKPCQLRNHHSFGAFKSTRQCGSVC
jgi:hypothetical protein